MVVVTVEATMESDQLKLLGRSVAPVDVAVADAGATGLRVFVNEPSAIASVASVLEGISGTPIRGGKGPILFCLMDPTLPGEVEIDLGGDFPINPQIKGAIKSLSGVQEVAEL